MSRCKFFRPRCDLTGKRFGKCIVIRELTQSPRRSGQSRVWELRCDCGNVIQKYQNNLHAKNVQCNQCWRQQASELRNEPLEDLQRELVGRSLLGGVVVSVKEITCKNQKRKVCVVRCDCGAIIEKMASQIRTGRMTGRCRSCGISLAQALKAPLYDLTGERFGKLTVIRKSPRHQRRRGATTTWECRCDCGGLHDASRTNLRHGHTTRCEKCHHEERSERMHRRNAEKNLEAQFITLQEKLYAKLGSTD